LPGFPHPGDPSRESCCSNPGIGLYSVKQKLVPGKLNERFRTLRFFTLRFRTLRLRTVRFHTPRFRTAGFFTVE